MFSVSSTLVKNLRYVFFLFFHLIRVESKLRTSLIDIRLGCTGSEALLITNEDEVLSCGLNNSGCLGQGNNEESSAMPKSIDVLRGKNVRGNNLRSSKNVFILFLLPV